MTLTRRNFIKGLSAIAVVPLVPSVLIPTEKLGFVPISEYKNKVFTGEPEIGSVSWNCCYESEKLNNNWIVRMEKGVTG